MRRNTQRGDYRTWLLLVLALVPTWSVLAGAAWLWSERGAEMDDFESALYSVDLTYEVFELSQQVLQAEASLEAAALPDASQEIFNRAVQDKAAVLIALDQADRQLVPLFEQQPAPDDNEQMATLSLIGGSLGLTRDLVEQQVPGEPVDPALGFITGLARDTATGLVLPFLHSGDRETSYLFDIMSTTIRYQEQLDRDRDEIIDHFGRNTNTIDLSDRARSALRDTEWRDLTDARATIPVVTHIQWEATVVISEAPLFLDTTEPLGTVFAAFEPEFTPETRDALILEMQRIDNTLSSDVTTAFNELHQESDNYLAGLVQERFLMAVTSAVMAAVALALAGLTIAEVRGRRRVEVAHDDAMHLLAEKADRDPTTGVWNRRRLEADIERMIEDSQANDEAVVVACLDLDHFKAVNDVWGHSTGDQVLQTITERLDGFVYGDTSFELCRLGGDEFVLYAQVEQKSYEWLKAFGQRIIKVINPEMEIDGRRHEVGVSVGVATSTEDSNLDSLLLEADSSLILAKRERGTAVVYNRRISRTGELVHALPAAIADGEISAHIQPVVDIRTGKVSHVEALARWHRHNGEDVSPGVFVPLVESYGLAEALTTNMVARAREIVEDPATPAGLRVWINVSPRELDVANFDRRFVAMLNEQGIAPNRIGIEITETAAVRDPVRLGKVLRLVRSVGVQVAIDDFGNGYSPLGYLRTLPVDTVKLDRSLISHIDSDTANQHLVVGIVGLVYELGMSIVAEGVERREEEAWLMEHGVHLVQGFLFGRPSHPESFDWEPRKTQTVQRAALAESARDAVDLGLSVP